MTEPCEVPASHRRDPERRSRIIDAALTVIASHGVAGTSVRRVAEMAKVPLGSMTYHFTGVEQLLQEAFVRFTDRAVDAFQGEFEGVVTLEDARSALVRILTEASYMDVDNIAIGAELYSLAARNPVFRPIQLGWMHRSRDAIRRHFDEATTHMLDAMIEGLSVHRSFEVDRHPEELLRVVIERMTPPESFLGSHPEHDLPGRGCDPVIA